MQPGAEADANAAEAGAPKAGPGQAITAKAGAARQLLETANIYATHTHTYTYPFGKTVMAAFARA